jgi:hypothetical protein
VCVSVSVSCVVLLVLVVWCGVVLSVECFRMWIGAFWGAVWNLLGQPCRTRYSLIRPRCRFIRFDSFNRQPLTDATDHPPTSAKGMNESIESIESITAPSLIHPSIHLTVHTLSTVLITNTNNRLTLARTYDRESSIFTIPELN